MAKVIKSTTRGEGRRRGGRPPKQQPVASYAPAAHFFGPEVGEQVGRVPPAARHELFYDMLSHFMQERPRVNEMGPGGVYRPPVKEWRFRTGVDPIREAPVTSRWDPSIMKDDSPEKEALIQEKREDMSRIGAGKKPRKNWA